MAFINGKEILFSPNLIIAEGGDTEAAFEEGRRAERAEFWDDFTSKGKRARYSNAFQFWGQEYIRPTRVIVPTDVNSGNQTFSACSNLKVIEKDYFDFSQKTRGTSNNQQGWYVTFSNCSLLEVIEDIGMQADYAWANTFTWCAKLHTIEVLRTDENTKWGSTFNGCYALQNITIDGTIGQNGFDIHHSTKLTKASIISILEACNTQVAAVTITLPTKCIDGSTDTKTMLEGLTSQKNYLIEDTSAATHIQLQDTKVIPGTVKLYPYDKSGTQCDAMRYDDGQGNIYAENIPDMVMGSINYETGLIEMYNPMALAEDLRVEYTTNNSPYAKARALGYNIAFA